MSLGSRFNPFPSVKSAEHFGFFFFQPSADSGLVLVRKSQKIGAFFEYVIGYARKG